MRSLIFFLTLVLITSCSIEKRHYRTGWYIDKAGKGSNSVDAPAIAEEARVDKAQQQSVFMDTLRAETKSSVLEVKSDRREKGQPNKYSAVEEMRRVDHIAQGLGMREVIYRHETKSEVPQAGVDGAAEEQLQSDANMSLFLIVISYLCIAALFVMLFMELLAIYAIITSVMSIVTAIASITLSARVMRIYKKMEIRKARGRNIAELALALGISYGLIILLPILLIGFLWLMSGGAL